MTVNRLSIFFIITLLDLERSFYFQIDNFISSANVNRIYVRRADTRKKRLIAPNFLCDFAPLREIQSRAKSQSRKEERRVRLQLSLPVVYQQWTR